MYIDSYYIILVLPTLLFSLIARLYVQSAFAKYSRIPCTRRLTGKEAAQYLLQANHISDVSTEPVRGSLTDHYDPRSKVLRLSNSSYGKASIAAVGIAAHETGHAIQHATHYGPLGLRSSLVPVANIGSSIGPWLAMAGFFFSLPVLVNLGIILFGGAVLFYLITLPVEFNASARAIALLRKNNILNEDELRGVKTVLTAAALTYVASALTALMNFLRLILLSQRRRS